MSEDQNLMKRTDRFWGAIMHATKPGGDLYFLIGFA
jgi:hypothetical protein